LCAIFSDVFFVFKCGVDTLPGMADLDYRRVVPWRDSVIRYQNELGVLRGNLDVDQWPELDLVERYIRMGGEQMEFLRRHRDFCLIMLKPFIYRQLRFTREFALLNGSEVFDLDSVQTAINYFFVDTIDEPLEGDDIWHWVTNGLHTANETLTPPDDVHYDAVNDRARSVLYVSLWFIADLFAVTPLNPAEAAAVLLPWIREIWEHTLWESENFLQQADREFDRAFTLLADYFTNRAYHAGPMRYLRGVADVRGRTGRPGPLPWELVDRIARTYEHPGEEEAFREMGLGLLWQELAVLPIHHAEVVQFPEELVGNF